MGAGDQALDYIGTSYPGARLTTARAASSYGQQVLVINGGAYGPAEILRNGMVAREWVREAMRHREREHRGDEQLTWPWY